MDEVKQQGDVSHLPPKEKRNKLPLILAGLVVLLVAAYAALCVYVSMSSKILPNVQVGDTLVGNMTVAAAASQIEADAEARFSPCTVEVTYSTNGSLSVPGSYIAADGHNAALDAYSVGRSNSVFLYGFHFLKALMSPTTLELPVTLNSDFPQADTLLDDAFQNHETQVIQSTYVVEEAAIQVVKGTSGLQYDREAVAQTLMQAIVDAANGNGSGSVRVEPVRTDPDPIDWDALAAQVAVVPSDAALDPETAEIVPSVTGVGLNVSEAERLYAQAADGDSLTIPLTLTEPEMTTEELKATLFRDTLGETTTWISGVANRLANVTLAAKMCNDIILMPGDEFSYWSIVGPCSTAQGFLPAPSYVNGETVDSIAGGICQVSSSIYYTALKANLEIVERRNHTYAVEYVPDGADATVFSGSPDFRFKNNTEHPIKLVAVAKGRNLSVQILGTKTDDTYVKMQFIRLSTTEPTTIYKADETIPVGTTKVSVTPYTGRKVEAYRCVYNGDGTLLSKTLESVNNYKKRDQIILCNPADLHLYDPTVPAPTPSVVPEPSISPEPSLSPAPTESAAPSEVPPVTPDPSETPAAAETPLPESSASPSQPPAAPSETPGSPEDLTETGE